MKDVKLPKMPKFKSESEEADWWYKNRKIVEAQLLKAKKTMSPTEVLERENRKSQTKAISIRLPVSDIELAKQRARTKGIGYQTLLRMLVHESLKRPAAKL